MKSLPCPIVPARPTPKPIGVAVFSGSISGTIHFIPLPDLPHRIHITGTISGLTPGDHGFHIHEYGDLTDGCTSACAHWDPYESHHHGLPGDPRTKRHAGDLGNIRANKNGIAKVNLVDNLITTSGSYTIIGRSLIIHADPDDGGRGGHEDSLITGHAGKRIACAVIGFSKPL